MHSTIDVVSTFDRQAQRPARRDETYQVFASNLKRAPSFGRLLGSASFYIPSLQLHLWCRWLRDDRGSERIVMPHLDVEAPDGTRHRKTLVRFATAAAEQRFEREALRAIHLLISNGGDA
jgi:hypothetical protein